MSTIDTSSIILPLYIVVFIYLVIKVAIMSKKQEVMGELVRESASTILSLSKRVDYLEKDKSPRSINENLEKIQRSLSYEE